MSELEDKLNSLLSNQDAMAQVMQLAQSLSQSGAGAADSGSAASPPPPQSGAAAGNAMPSAGDLNAMLSQLTGGLDPALLSRLLPRSSTRCSPFCATSGATRSRGQRSSPSSSIWPRYF